MKNYLYSITALPAVALLTGAIFVSPVAAQVSTCDALTLYGNAANSGLCKTLSPGTQNLKVCELASSPDIHITFSAGTPLHLTVRDQAKQPSCEGNSMLNGIWPAALNIGANQPNRICGVDVQNWVNRLNAVPQVAPVGAQSNCGSGFVTAGNSGRLKPQEVTQYNQLCQQHNCP